jgi:VWFA-related protein
LRSDARDLLRQQMENIAEQTGGEVFVGTNNIAGALQKSLDAGENYYSLVYTPTNEKWNGRVRRIKVKMTHRGYTLSYRRTYIALPEPFGSPGGF